MSEWKKARDYIPPFNREVIVKLDNGMICSAHAVVYWNVETNLAGTFYINEWREIDKSSRDIN